MCIAILIHMDAMTLHIDPSATDPIYRQIVGQVARLIAAGHWPEGTRLPSVRDVAAAHAVNPMTVSKAYSLLEAQGLLTRERGKGMVVATPSQGTQTREDRMQALLPALTELARQARQLGLDADDVIAAWRPLMNQERNVE